MDDYDIAFEHADRILSDLEGRYGEVRHGMRNCFRVEIADLIVQIRDATVEPAPCGQRPKDHDPKEREAKPAHTVPGGQVL